MDLHQANKLLLEREERYKSFIRHSLEGIFRLEMEDGTEVSIHWPEEKLLSLFLNHVVVAECNDVLAQMCGYTSHEEMIGVRLKDILLPTTQNLENIKTFIRNGFKLVDVETAELDKQGNIKYFLNSLFGIVCDGILIRVWGTQKDITDIKKAGEALVEMNTKLSHKNAELVRMNNELDSLIYTVSHDLNSPLSNIEGLVNVLKLKDCYADEDVKNLVDLMGVAVEKFKGTIKNIAEVPKSQIREGNKTVESLFSEILENVRFSVKNLLHDTGATLDSQFLIPSMPVKPSSLQSVMYNLVNNAIKYRSPHRKPIILVSTYEERDFIALEVKDNGIGFNNEQGIDIFNLFTRLHGHVEGSGLGLYIVKRIAENYGGRAEAISTPGDGSIFRVLFKK